jgi:hypothetical protein
MSAMAAFVHHCIAHPMLFFLELLQHLGNMFHDWTGRIAWPEES